MDLISQYSKKPYNSRIVVPSSLTPGLEKFPCGLTISLNLTIQIESNDASDLLGFKGRSAPDVAGSKPIITAIYCAGFANCQSGNALQYGAALHRDSLPDCWRQPEQLEGQEPSPQSGTHSRDLKCTQHNCIDLLATPHCRAAKKGINGAVDYLKRLAISPDHDAIESLISYSPGFPSCFRVQYSAFGPSITFFFQCSVSSMDRLLTFARLHLANNADGTKTTCTEDSSFVFKRHCWIWRRRTDRRGMCSASNA
jgi:hypothetical protein